jgi:enamine deaminase RidA (YjgF/YER057c/UK114 family)
MSVESRFAELGLELPPAPKPAGNYVATVRAGSLLFVSGQFPIENGVARYVGRVGAELSESDGYAAARLAALNVLAQIRAALGGFEGFEQLVRVEGHVASAPAWNNAPKVLDGASDLFLAVLGERGRHTRAAFTPASLPLNLAVEIVVVVSIKPE